MRRWIAWSGAMSVLLLSFMASPAHAADKVVFGYFPVADFLMTFIAKDQGFFEKHGIDATIQMMATNATSVPAALVSNSIQIGGTTVPVILQANDSGLDVATVANGGITYAGFHPIALVVASDSPAKTSKARRSASRVSTISCISSSSNGSASMAPIRRRSISSKPISSRCPIS